MELAFTVSSLWGECTFSAFEAIHIVPIVVPPVPITAGWSEVLWIQSLSPVRLHMPSTAGIEPQTPRSRVQCLDHCATHSTNPGDKTLRPIIIMMINITLTSE